MTVDSGHIYAPPQQRQKMVFQKPIMLRRSARQYLKFLCPELDTQQLSGWLARAGLSHRTDTPARALSGGEQQKLALIGALATRPDILFLDEPTAGINPTLINGLIDRLKRANEEMGVTLFVIEHNMRVVMNLASHVFCLAHGKLLAGGPPSEIQNDQKVIDAYLGAH